MGEADPRLNFLRLVINRHTVSARLRTGPRHSSPPPLEGSLITHVKAQQQLVTYRCLQSNVLLLLDPDRNSYEEGP